MHPRRRRLTLVGHVWKRNTVTRGTHRVWFNKGLSNTYDAIRIIRGADAHRQLELFASHTLPDAAVLTVADRAWVEPRTVASDQEYVAWCLDRCLEHSVDLFVAQRRRIAISSARSRFEERGVRVMVLGDAPTLELVERKDAFYRDLAGSGIPIPRFRIARTLDEFDHAYRDLRDEGAEVCVKPTVSVNGAGFRILIEGGDEFDRLMRGDVTSIGLETFRRVLATTSAPRDLMVMEYLPGPERSVDCVALDGRLVSAVSRVKLGQNQALEASGASIEIARRLTERYRFDGMFNLQTRELDGRPYLLEINSRMSGGILFACLSGVALPYWAVTLALGIHQPGDVPLPWAGARVAPVTAAITVDAEAAHGAAEHEVLAPR